MSERSVRPPGRKSVIPVVGTVALAIGLLALLLCVLSSQRPFRGTSVPVDTSPDSLAPRLKIRLHWQIPSRGLTSVNFSPDGEFISFVDRQGAARCYDKDGMLRWSLRIPGAQHVLVGPGGEFSVAYSLLNPMQRRLYFLANDGQVCWKREVEGAPWCVAVSADRSRFAVGTGERFVYVCLLGKRTRRYLRWRVEGAVTSLSFLSSPDRLLLGSWQDSSVGLYRLNGGCDWHQLGEQDKLYFVEADDSADAVLSLAVPNRRVPYAVLTLMDRTGDRLWRKELEGSEIRASISRSKRHVAVGFLTSIEHKGQQVAERHVALYDDTGNLLWDKGGMFFKPRLIGTLSRDAVLVCDEKFIYVLDRKGKVSAKEKLASAIRNWWTDRSNRRLLILCKDGRLYYYTMEY